MNFPVINFDSLAPLVLLAVRIGGLMTFAPFLGSTTISWQIKSGLTVALTALLGPAYLTRVSASAPANLLASIPGELMIGLGLGLVLEGVFEGARIAGNLLGFQFGYSLVNVIDPQTEVETTVLTFFHYTILLLIFLQGDMHLWLLRLMVHSFDVVKPGGLVFSASAVATLLHAAGGMFVMGLQLAAPALMVTLMADMALAFMAKASPQLPILLVGLPLKMLAGYAAMWAAVAFWPVLAQKWFFAAVRNAEQLVERMH